MRYRLEQSGEQGVKVLWQARLPTFRAALLLASWTLPELSYPACSGLSDLDAMEFFDAPQSEQRQGRGKCVATLRPVVDSDDDWLLLGE